MCIRICQGASMSKDDPTSCVYVLPRCLDQPAGTLILGFQRCRDGPLLARPPALNPERLEPRPSFSSHSETCCIAAANRIIGLHPPALASLSEGRPCASARGRAETHQRPPQARHGRKGTAGRLKSLNASCAFNSPRSRRPRFSTLAAPDSLQVDQPPELAQFVLDLDQQLVERGVIRHRRVDVAGETDGRELRVTILRHLLTAASALSIGNRRSLLKAPQ